MSRFYLSVDALHPVLVLLNGYLCNDLSRLVGAYYIELLERPQVHSHLPHLHPDLYGSPLWICLFEIILYTKPPKHITFTIQSLTQDWQLVSYGWYLPGNIMPSVPLQPCFMYNETHYIQHDDDTTRGDDCAFTLRFYCASKTVVVVPLALEILER
jgi:hypothetical protein